MPPKRQQTHSSDSVSKRAKTTCTDIVLREEVVAVPGTEGGSCGKGWPFAPEGWPLPGDVWGWRVGRRKSHSGLFWHDRTLYLPERLKGTANPPCFASKVKLEKYLRAHFPTINLSAFFSSFHWRIPCASPAEKAFEKQEGNMKGDAEKKKTCKVGNRKCALLTRKKRQYKTMSCEICCTEPGFCGECCCILCGMVTDQGPKEFSSIKCEGKLNDEFICGHVAHLECAVGCCLAGVVTEIGADLEYYCRRCDRKTDLIMHIKGLIKESQYMKSRDSVENYLRLAFHIIQGTERIGGKTVQNAIESTLNKFCNGMELQGIAELEEMIEMLREGPVRVEQKAGPVVSPEVERAEPVHPPPRHGRSLTIQTATICVERHFGDFMSRLEPEVDQRLSNLQLRWILDAHGTYYVSETREFYDTMHIERRPDSRGHLVDMIVASIRDHEIAVHPNDIAAVTDLGCVGSLHIHSTGGTEQRHTYGTALDISADLTLDRQGVLVTQLTPAYRVLYRGLIHNISPSFHDSHAMVAHLQILAAIRQGEQMDLPTFIWRRLRSMVEARQLQTLGYPCFLSAMFRRFGIPEPIGEQRFTHIQTSARYLQDMGIQIPEEAERPQVQGPAVGVTLEQIQALLAETTEIIKGFVDRGIQALDQRIEQMIQTLEQRIQMVERRVQYFEEQVVDIRQRVVSIEQSVTIDLPEAVRVQGDEIVRSICTLLDLRFSTDP